jgi:hypothetical protein
VIEKLEIAARDLLPPLPVAIAATPVSGQVSPAKTRQLTVSVIGPSVASTATLLPLPDEVDETPSGTVVSSQHAAVVTYRDGQLTIDAENSTLAAVLELVAKKTGAVIDVPPGSGLERIFEHAGPGPAEDVLAQLLNGSPFDFIIVGSPQGPHHPAQVLLSLHRADTPASLQDQPPKTLSASALWTPPEVAPAAPILPVLVDPGSLPPKEALTPEVLGQLMRDKARQLREQLQQQQPPQ